MLSRVNYNDDDDVIQHLDMVPYICLKSFKGAEFSTKFITKIRYDIEFSHLLHHLKFKPDDNCRSQNLLMDDSIISLLCVFFLQIVLLPSLLQSIDPTIYQSNDLSPICVVFQISNIPLGGGTLGILGFLSGRPSGLKDTGSTMSAASLYSYFMRTSKSFLCPSSSFIALLARHHWSNLRVLGLELWRLSLWPNCSCMGIIQSVGYAVLLFFHHVGYHF